MISVRHTFEIDEAEFLYAMFWDGQEDGIIRRLGLNEQPEDFELVSVYMVGNPGQRVVEVTVRRGLTT